MRWSWLGVGGAALVGVALALTACPSPQRHNSVAINVRACVPGATNLCACPGDQAGVQTCADDGQSFGPCERCAAVARAVTTVVAKPSPHHHDDDEDEDDWDDEDDFGPPYPTAKASTSPTYAPTYAPTSTPWSGPPVLWGAPTVNAMSPPVPPGNCKPYRACTQSARCTMTSAGCALTSDADCRLADDCAHRGECTFEKSTGKYDYPSCIATKHKDCKASTVCANLGKCSASKKYCVALKNSDCKAADVCTSHGLCSADSGRCSAKTNADCKGSTACKSYGYCKAQGGYCIK